MLRHYLQWHIIHSCNLRCVHCYQENYDAAMSREDMSAVLDRYEAYLALHGYEGQINLTGGEPLLHPLFWDLVEEIRRRGLYFAVLTNGTLIDDGAAKRLSLLRPVFVQISLDGMREIHDRIRGQGNYDRALRGIDLLKKHGVKVLVSFTAMKENAGKNASRRAAVGLRQQEAGGLRALATKEQRKNASEFTALARELKKHRVDKLWWDRVVTDDPEQYLSTEEFRALAGEAVQLSKRPGYSFISNARALEGLPEGCARYECSAGKRLLIVLANGDLMPCRRLPFVIGNLRDIPETGGLDSFLRNSEVMQRLAAPAVPEGCENCRLRGTCAGGAKCVTFAQTGELNRKDVNCWVM